jgi:ABC-2 type transport system permease protein
MDRLTAFLKRDFLGILSYRFRLFMNFGSLLVGVFFLFFIGRTFKDSFSQYLSRYGNDYFAFALIGMSVSTFVSTGLNSLANEVRGAQVEGTLEALLVTPAPANVILFGNSLWSFVESFVESVLYLALAVVIIGLDVTVVKVGLVLVILLLTFACFLALGMVSAAFIMAFKQGNPIGLLFGTSSYFLGGLLFPVDVLPAPLQAASFLLPITHASKAVREILLVQGNKGDWLSTLVFLAAFAAVTLPVGFILLRLSLSRAKREGSLVQF